MTSRFKNISEWIAKACDCYMDLNKSSGLLMGLIDKQLRSQGVPADAITVELPAKKLKLIVVVHDDLNNKIEVHTGNRNGDIYSSISEDFNKLSEERIQEIIFAELSRDIN